jgi:hypothetical protein
MNELIQKLAEESGLDARTMGFQNHHTEQWNARVSKLTQLIVQECGNIAFEHWVLTHDTSPQEAILKYFGVDP